MVHLNWHCCTLVVIFFIINCINCQVLFKENKKQNEGKLNIKKYSNQEKKLSRYERNVHISKSVDMTDICKEICESRHNKECKMTIKYKNYQADKKICTCVDEIGEIVDSKIYKSPQSVKSGKDKKVGNVILTKVSMSCKKSEKNSYEMCQNYCKVFTNSKNFDCSDDASQCLCYGKIKNKLRSMRRKSRQMISESVLDDGTEVVGMSVTPRRLRQPQYFGGYQRPPPMPMPMPHPGCNPYTCMNQCPYGCDSLCRANMECYCSCPEDLTYEYYDDGHSLFGSLFG